jgi:uncharacterized RDD family membrane protein YckC
MARMSRDEELSPSAMAFLEAQLGIKSDRPSGALDLTGGSASKGSEKYGEKPVAWIRIISYLVDSLIVGLPFAMLAWPVFIAEMDAPMVGPGGKVVGQVAGSAAGELVIWKYLLMYSVLRGIYSIALESSSLQATFGKMMCGLVVTNQQMQKPSLGGIIMRNTLGRLVLNVIPFSIGYWMLAFNPQKKGLHDMMGGTLVCTKGTAPSETFSQVFA